jgi:hypothetical protein
MRTLVKCKFTLFLVYRSLRFGRVSCVVGKNNEFEFWSCVVGKKSWVVRKSRGSKNALNFHFFAETLLLLK